MNRQRFLKIVSHPLLVSAILTILLFLFMIPEIPRYRFHLLETIPTPSLNSRFFSDLDRDGNSEEIKVNFREPLLEIVVSKGPVFINQYNLRSQPLDEEYLCTGDSNGDGLEEIFILTLRRDSILLNIIDPLGGGGIILKDRLVYFNDSVHYELDIPAVTMSDVVSLREGGRASFLFSISTGYSKLPRNLFRYDPEGDHLTSSPLMGSAIYDPVVCDLDADSVPEILIQTSATGNFPASFPFSDQSSWLMVMNSDLRFRFEPVELRGHPAYFHVVPIRTGDETFLVACHDSYGMNSSGPEVLLFDTWGNPMASKQLTQQGGENYFICATQERQGPRIHLLNAAEGTVTVLDSELQVQKVRKTRQLYRALPIMAADIDRDDHREYLCLSEVVGELVIFRDDLTDGVLVDPGQPGFPLHATPYLKDGAPQLYIQYAEVGYLGRYEKHPLSPLKIPVGILLFVAIYAAIYGLYRLQQYRARLQFQTQKKIGELQILALKNQIDPHFTFNVLNSIGSLYERESRKQNAYEVFVKYSQLLRAAIRNSDKISIPLQEELDFVRTYIGLEISRNEPSFTSNIEVSKEVDLSLPVPRMLIHSFVENAIKHGIRTRRGDGELAVEVIRFDRSVRILVRDNGPGPDYRISPLPQSTGKGLQIVDELIRLFNNLEGTRISYELKAVMSGEAVCGTAVTITIPDRPTAFVVSGSEGPA